MHDYGLAYDLAMMTDRRQLLGWLAVAAALPLVGCEGEETPDGKGSPNDTGSPEDTGSLEDTGSPEVDTCTTIPKETAGPFPADGSNGPDALTLADIVRSDIRSSIGELSGTAEGIPLSIRLRLVDVAGCTPLLGFVAYLWHCNREGHYSMYEVTDQNYLRGVQLSDADGYVTFQSIFPAAYKGRWPHLHLEVYASLEGTSSARSAVATTQLALPQATCNQVYATAGYEKSAKHLENLSLSTDGVFKDGFSTQLPAMTGDVVAGFELSLEVGVSLSPTDRSG